MRIRSEEGVPGVSAELAESLRDMRAATPDILSDNFRKQITPPVGIPPAQAGGTLTLSTDQTTLGVSYTTDQDFNVRQTDGSLTATVGGVPGATVQLLEVKGNEAGRILAEGVGIGSASMTAYTSSDGTPLIPTTFDSDGKPTGFKVADDSKMTFYKNKDKGTLLLEDNKAVEGAKGTVSDTSTAAQDRTQATYGAVAAVWNFMMSYMDDWVYDQVEDMCREDYESSDFVFGEEEGLQDIVADVPEIPGDDPCGLVNDEVTGNHHAEVSIVGDDGIFRYDYDYHLKNCDQAFGPIRVTVWLRGVRQQDLNLTTIGYNTGKVQEYQSWESTFEYTEICVDMSGYPKWGTNGRLCLPIVKASS